MTITMTGILVSCACGREIVSERVNGARRVEREKTRGTRDQAQ